MAHALDSGGAVSDSIFEILRDTPTTEEVDKYAEIENRFVGQNMAKLQARLRRYKAVAAGKNGVFLLTERHYSSRLGLFMRADGHPRPGVGWEAHHIVSGTHEEAAGARVHLAGRNVKIRIDDPDNGTWLPKERKFAWNSIYPHAIPHENLHRYKYYQWVEQLLSGSSNEGLTRAVLNVIRTQLLHGNVKKELLAEIDNAAYTKFSKRDNDNL